MDRFYSYCRNEDNGIGFIPHDGSRVKNTFGLTLYVYHSNETYDYKNGKGKSWWYVVEERTGLAMGRGHTRKEAIDNALTAINMRGVEVVKQDIEDTVAKHGLPPHLQPTYL